jgi:hypothetical protein
LYVFGSSLYWQRRRRSSEDVRAMEIQFQLVCIGREGGGAVKT